MQSGNHSFAKLLPTLNSGLPFPAYVGFGTNLTEAILNLWKV
jgi:hypothetical protein